MLTRRNFLLSSFWSFLFLGFVEFVGFQKEEYINVKICNIPGEIKDITVLKGTKLKDLVYKECTYVNNITEIVLKDKSNVDNHGRIVDSSCFLVVRIIRGPYGRAVARREKQYEIREY